jgi:hypothetical protein
MNRSASGRFIYLAISMIVSLFVSGLVGATPIPAGSSSSSDIIFNVDFSSSTPSPPYDTVKVIVDLSGFGAGETLSTDFYSELNGVGLIVLVSQAGPAASVPNQFSGLADIDDGVFSIGLHLLTGGAADLTGLTVQATSDGFVTFAQLTLAPVAQVPEPDTLVLVGCALIAYVALRRKRQANRRCPDDAATGFDALHAVHVEREHVRHPRRRRHRLRADAAEEARH